MCQRRNLWSLHAGSKLLTMTITSSAFQPNEPIPAEYGFAGQNVNPPLTFSEVSKEAKSLALILEDPDAPGDLFTHWIVFNISPATLQILAGTLPIGAEEATSDYGTVGYGGPKPPSGTHRYVFSLFALDTTLDIDSTAKRPEFYEAIEGHIIDRAELTGLFSA